MTSQLTVVDLAASITQATQHLTPEPIWITGTLTTWKRSRSWTRGELTIYKGTDPAAKLQLGCPTKTAIGISKGFAAEQKKLSTGIDVAVLGQLDFHPVYGMRFAVKTIAAGTATESQTTEDRRQLIEHLHATGVGTRQHQLTVPATVRTVGLVTPIAGDAARADAINILATHNDVLLDERRVPTAGPRAANAIRKAIGQLEATSDIILCIRGGGSSADLTVFDDQRVVTAIATCLRPVVVGVGHATDQLLATDVAHHGATTPTAAAQWISELLTPQPSQIIERPVVTETVVYRDQPRDVRPYLALAAAVLVIVALLIFVISQHL